MKYKDNYNALGQPRAWIFDTHIQNLYTERKKARFQNCKAVLEKLFIIKENICKKSMKRFWAFLLIFTILKVSVFKGFGTRLFAIPVCRR